MAAVIAYFLLTNFALDEAGLILDCKTACQKGYIKSELLYKRCGHTSICDVFGKPEGINKILQLQTSEQPEQLEQPKGINTILQLQTSEQPESENDVCDYLCSLQIGGHACECSKPGFPG
ncbi:hypothetical protein SNE40_004351 [Patella caerulea]|uniref:Uncharacterized protein n=1 Tax=Patella caerulea TaxID=87958 RepID=A0AAN8PX33_PATCE